MRQYQGLQFIPGNPRQNEARALIEAARRLSDAQKIAESPEKVDKEAVQAALRLNWRLWTILQVEALADDNPNPKEIRQNILKLSIFVDDRTVDILFDPKPPKFDMLIKINREVAQGLLANKDTAQPAVVPAAEAATKLRSIAPV